MGAQARQDVGKGRAHVLVDGSIAHEYQRDVLQRLARGQVLGDGHEVAQGLAGVQVGAHAVDDGNGGVFGQLGNFVVVAGANLDGIQKARHDQRGVLYGFGFAQVNFTRTQVQRVAAEFGHGHLEGDARTGGRLVENHAEARAVQKRRAGP